MSNDNCFHQKFGVIKSVSVIFIMICLIAFFTACSNKDNDALLNQMTETERSSVETLSETEFLLVDDELDSKFMVQMTFPPDYKSAKEYPLFLITDGVWSYYYHAEFYDMMADDKISDVILVSLSFDPDMNNEADETRYQYFVKNNKAFLDFIIDNLMPYLNENYKIDFTNSTFGGHSLGGLFCHYALFNSDLYEN